ncbi:MAG: ABC transporter ATP-binding protein [Bosea sp.]|uniref:ABC transporter ATP-binding protein n=1 Tax=Bosea sp. (in: a-proteobacteria) TaxID=1871050 RepID=UPI00238DEAE5|nr:ABC transporter ATP-binding protein [Bosea sp. (in: a-proteobacteria)]MCP4737003.1 ABC transporter ATP-binding protein [Bosea sp. (in: a-proteobacteria)]
MPEHSPAGATPALDIAGLRAWYGASQALFDVSFRVMPGEVVGLVGRNGAGKTTILRSVMGLLPRQAGEIAVSGRNAAALSPAERARAGIGYCPEERAVFASLTVAENLSLPPRVGDGGLSEAEIFPNLESRKRHYGGQLSGGEQQMLAIGRILRTGARTLLLDEPTEGLAPVIVRQIETALSTLKRRGYTILLVEQNLSFVLRVADRVVAIEQGAVVAESDVGDPTETERRLAHHLAL